MIRRLSGAVLGCALLVGACHTGPEEQRAETTHDVAGSRPSVTPKTFTMAATGDILVHPELTEQAAEDAREDTETGEEFDFQPLLEGVQPLMSGVDLALCHLEVPLGAEGEPYSGYPQFNAPPEVAEALADVGYDSCSTASNHVLDQGTNGVTSTLDALDDAGIEHTGSARTQEEADTPLVLDVDGISVGHLSYTYGFNGLQPPEDEPWRANEIDPEAIVAEAEEARAAGAEVVIVSLHAGEEYEHEPTTEQEELAEQLLGEEAVDLIIGHHAHVVQPIEQVNEKWVAYGLGNSVARHAEPRGTTEEGAAARFSFTRTGNGWVVDDAQYIPTLVELGSPIRLVDLTTADPNPRRTEALQRIDENILDRDADQDGLTRPGK